MPENTKGLSLDFLFGTTTPRPTTQQDVLGDVLDEGERDLVAEAVPKGPERQDAGGGSFRLMGCSCSLWFLEKFTSKRVVDDVVASWFLQTRCCKLQLLNNLGVSAMCVTHVPHLGCFASGSSNIVRFRVLFHLPPWVSWPGVFSFSSGKAEKPRGTDRASTGVALANHPASLQPESGGCTRAGPMHRLGLGT